MNVIKSILEQNYPLEDYAIYLGYNIRYSGRDTLKLREHDSLTIFTKTNTFYRYSTGEYGNIINLHCTLTRDSIKKAVNDLRYFLEIDDKEKQIVKKDTVNRTIQNIENKSKEELLEDQRPSKGLTNNNVYNYLIKRNIKKEVIDEFIERDLLYEGSKRECVFTSYKNGKLNFMQTDNTRGFKCSFKGNDYNTYYIDNKSRATIVTESIIDTMSIMSLLIKRNKNIKDYNYISLCGCSNIKSVYNHCINKDIDYLILGLDNDNAGHLAKDKIINKLRNSDIKLHLKIKTFITKNSKDWNEELQLIENNPWIIEQYIKKNRIESIEQERKERIVT